MLRYLLLDLDNTLYSDSVGMEREILGRMNAYVAAYLGLEVSAAAELRRERTRRYGTTLEWLMAEEGLEDVEAYYAAVHPEGEEECIAADPALGAILDSIDLPKAVFTNAPLEHAHRVLERLGVGERFRAIYDIRYNGHRGKPHAEAFRRVCAACGVSPSEALFVDDLPKYVQGFVDIGGNAVLIDEQDRFPSLPYVRIHSLAELPALVEGFRAAETQLSLF